MKKLVFFLLCIMAASLLHAQSLDDVKDAMGDNIMTAKTLVDRYLSNPKNAAKPDGWYYKGKIYDQISKSDSLKSACADCRMEAFEAFKKYQQLDSKNLLMIMENNGSLFDIYNGYFDLAAKEFNEKDFSNALRDFKNALSAEDYIKSKDFDYNGFKFPAFDTSLVLNLAITARAGNDDSDAVAYYKQLTDLNVSGPMYKEAYEYLVQHYRQVKDSVDFSATLAKGQKIYPDDSYWVNVQMDAIEANGNKEEALKKYEDLASQNPSDFTLNYNYAVELYNYLYADQNKEPSDADEYKKKAMDQINKTIAIDTTPASNLLMARFLYNSSFDDQDAADKIKGAKPEDVKQRKALRDSATSLIDQAIVYGEKVEKSYEAMPLLTADDKNNYRGALGILQNLYTAKNNTVKANECLAKLKDLK